MDASGYATMDSITMPGSWAEWMEQIGGKLESTGSGAIIKEAVRFSAAAGISLESSISMLAWLGSVVMNNFTSVIWESGIWHPSGLIISSVEPDGVQIDSITAGFINMVKYLGLDPIQDTVKEGPSGLIARLEDARGRIGKKQRNQAIDSRRTSLADLVEMDTSLVDPTEPSNIGNVRGLIYPSGRAFLSYLYDTPFFNAIDELIQHGSLHVRGKVDAHTMSEMNIVMFLPFYQGALANLMQSVLVQNNINVLLRQMLVLWAPSQDKVHTRSRNVGSALNAIKEKAQEGIAVLSDLMPPALHVRHRPEASEPMFDVGIGVRYVKVNRQERLARLAIAVAFWRMPAGNMSFELLDSDYAVADAILHGHEMGSRILEIASSKGRIGAEALRMFVSLSETSDSMALATSLSQATDEKLGSSVLLLLNGMSVLNDNGGLHESYRIVNGDVIKEHKRRWRY